MRVRSLAFCIGIAGITSLFLVGCNSNNMPAPAVPVVTFTSPEQPVTISFGQAVNLKWTASNATTCLASTPSSTGGAFSGSQPVSGAATVAPTDPGQTEYILTCTGPGGSTTATSQLVMVNPSTLSSLLPNSITMIGSTPDPIEMGGNPYGLTIAPATAGLMTQGDLVACNFNDGATNTQGLGTTIIGLHPTPGAMPYRIAQSSSLEGCNALAFGLNNVLYATAFSANDVPAVSPAGAVSNPLSGISFAGPWGTAFVPANGSNPAALYVSNLDGSIDRLVGDQGTKIATGFCGSGAPGAVFAPSGLTYDPSVDTLYIVDTSSNSVVAFANVSQIGAAGVVVSGQCTAVAAPPTAMPAFSGPSATSARVIANGGPFIAPISAALLADGDLIVGNGDINIANGQMPNLAIEVSPVLPGGFVGKPLQLDSTGVPGALFGIVTAVDSHGNQIVYFNDDNANAVMSITE